jgi:hypothetical protein
MTHSIRNINFFTLSLLYDNDDLRTLEFLFVGAGCEDRIRPAPMGIDCGSKH